MASAAPILVFIGPPSVHHSSAMRSGPSARSTRCRRRRHTKRNGGSSGSTQNASTGSGGANSRTGRGGLRMPLCKNPSPPFREEREGPSAQRWEGEVGIGRHSGILHLTPTLSAPRGGEGEARRRGLES